MKSIISLALIVGCCWLSCMTGCSLPGLKRSGTSSPTPSAQHSSNQAADRSEAPPSTTGGNEQPATSGNDISDELHTPAKGSEERQAMMDALRAEFDSRQSPYYTSHRGGITFVVNRLQVHNGWAWMNGYPQSSDPQDSFGEYSGFLLHSVDARWSVMRLPPMVSDPNDPENLDYPSRKDLEKIRQKYPTAPVDIFPK